MGKFHKAIEYFELSRKISDEFGDTRAWSDSLANIGNCHAELKDFSTALRCYREALNVQRENDYRHEMAHTLTNLAATHAEMKNTAEAILCYQEAIDLFNEVGDSTRAQWAHTQLQALA